MGLGSTRRIEFVETLGQGGFGAVYLADVHGRDAFVQRLAVKVLSEEMSAQDDIAARQRDEARLLAQLNHDHIG
jgi:serine/threonine protein kinase